MRRFFDEALTLDAASIRETRDGYVVASARIARTGIQAYTAGELGIEDRNPSDVIRVYRPADAVFDPKAMASMANRPMTNDHPKEDVTAKNWKDLAVGMSGGEVMRDGETVRVPLMLTDAGAITAWKGGKKELSVGYTCELTLQDGITDSGEAYDAVQSDIRANHIALCQTARGGHQLRIGDRRDDDRSPSDGEPAVKKIIVDGLEVETTDAAERAIVKLQGMLADATTAKAGLETKVAELTTSLATKDAELVTMKTQLDDSKLTPQQLRDAAKSFAKTIAVAKALAPSLQIADAMGEAEVRRAVVDARIGDAAKGWTDAQVDASFASLSAGVKVDDTAHRDPVRDAFSDGLGNMGDAETKADDAWRKSNSEMTDAWRGKAN